MTTTAVQEFASVWDALADTPEAAANLRLRSALMRQIADIVENSGWTQAEAAEGCNVTEPRINDLIRGRISRVAPSPIVKRDF